MGHYDTCRPENCSGCGQAKGVIWNCGHRNCSTYQQWLSTKDPVAYEELMQEIKIEEEEAEDKRVIERRREKAKQKRDEIAKKKHEDLKKKALSKLTASERKLLGLM